jgi:heme exporter protein C
MVPALYLIFIYAPIEVTQGNVQRIFYFHVPWRLPVAYLRVSCSLVLMYLIKRDLKWDRFFRCCRRNGCSLHHGTALTAVHWAKPVWGIWYAFDSRETLQLVLISDLHRLRDVTSLFASNEKQAKLGAVFGILAMIDVPFNYLSIYIFAPSILNPW